MATIKIGLALLWIVSLLFCSVACDDSVDQFNNYHLTKQERTLAKTWHYESVKIIHGQKSLLLDSMDYNFEILSPDSEFTPERTDITRRHIIYRPDHSYDLQWDRESYYVLGTGQNWQPQYGFWQFDSSGGFLIHNPALPYHVQYEIVKLNDHQFVRQSSRVMATTADSTIWHPGDTISFIETFVPAD